MNEFQSDRSSEAKRNMYISLKNPKNKHSSYMLEPHHRCWVWLPKVQKGTLANQYTTINKYTNTPGLSPIDYAMTG